MKKTIIAAALSSLLFTLPVNADVFDELDEEIAEQDNTDKIIEEYIAFVDAYLSEYDAWRSEYLQGYDKKQEKIINRWGGTTDQSVEYSKDMSTRKIVDYEKNEVTIEVVVPADTTASQGNKILIKNAEALQKTAPSDEVVKIDSKKIKSEDIAFTQKEEEVAKKAIKKQTVAYQKENDIAADKLVENNYVIPEDVVEKSALAKKEALKKEEAKRLKKVEAQYAKLREEKKPKNKILRYTVKLPKNSFSKRAAKYKHLAEKESQRFDLPVALVMAIMHSESAFNPKAKSGVPAYGLMQIVPRTAGHDVNKMLRKIDKPMQVKPLYVPEINVETGTYYLHILNARYLRKIKDPQSRLYCTIAAYNTGAGNVAKVFNKGSGRRTNINKAATFINKLSPDEVYSALMARLPYEETQHYLKKVYKRMDLYRAN
jgi:membrane-bound lytic murein transglycosylase C